MIDYKSLLERYMWRVISVEGYDFVPKDSYDSTHFSREEIIELERISKDYD